MWLDTNHEPVIKETTHAIWRRIREIPFSIQIKPENRIKDLAEQLKEKELSGILNWALEGCAMWKKHGLPMPDAIKRATAKYRIEMDEIGTFLEECITPDQDSSISLVLQREL